MRMRFLAEVVENSEGARTLISMGCDETHGVLLHKAHSVA